MLLGSWCFLLADEINISHQILNHLQRVKELLSFNPYSSENIPSCCLLLLMFCIELIIIKETFNQGASNFNHVFHRIKSGIDNRWVTEVFGLHLKPLLDSFKIILIHKPLSSWVFLIYKVFSVMMCLTFAYISITCFGNEVIYRNIVISKIWYSRYVEYEQM